MSTPIQKSQVAQNFYDYIYAGGVNATAATAKGLAWYDKNRTVYTPEQFIALWNEANGSKFNVADLDNALIQGGYAASTKTVKTGGAMLPLLYAVAVFYFLG